MSGEPFKDTRTRAGLTQAEMAGRLGMSLRGYQELEGGATPMREMHRLAMDMASLALANERGDYRLATATALGAAVDVYRLLHPGAACVDADSSAAEVLTRQA
jgi:transcriptional regulator with XRE-family HTH domain